MKESFKSDHLANILGGVMNSIIKSYNHHHSRFFGIMPDKDDKFWLAVIRQACAAVLKKDIEQYGLISLTPKGKEYLEKPYSIKITEDRKFEDTDEDESIT